MSTQPALGDRTGQATRPSCGVGIVGASRIATACALVGGAVAVRTRVMLSPHARRPPAKRAGQDRSRPLEQGPASALDRAVTVFSAAEERICGATDWTRGPNRNALDAPSYSTLVTPPDGGTTLSAEVMMALPSTSLAPSAIFRSCRQHRDVYLRICRHGMTAPTPQRRCRRPWRPRISCSCTPEDPRHSAGPPAAGSRPP
jgi:hypothetical protein